MFSLFKSSRTEQQQQQQQQQKQQKQQQQQFPTPCLLQLEEEEEEEEGLEGDNNDVESKSLHQWIPQQQRRHRSTPSDDQIQLLDNEGFLWDLEPQQQLQLQQQHQQDRSYGGTINSFTQSTLPSYAAATTMQQQYPEEPEAYNLEGDAVFQSNHYSVKNNAVSIGDGQQRFITQGDNEAQEQRKLQSLLQDDEQFLCVRQPIITNYKNNNTINNNNNNNDTGMLMVPPVPAYTTNGFTRVRTMVDGTWCCGTALHWDGKSYHVRLDNHHNYSEQHGLLPASSTIRDPAQSQLQHYRWILVSPLELETMVLNPPCEEILVGTRIALSFSYSCHNNRRHRQKDDEELPTFFDATVQKIRQGYLKRWCVRYDESQLEEWIDLQSMTFHKLLTTTKVKNGKTQKTRKKKRKQSSQKTIALSDPAHHHHPVLVSPTHQNTTGTLHRKEKHPKELSAAEILAGLSDDADDSDDTTPIAHRTAAEPNGIYQRPHLGHGYNFGGQQQQQQQPPFEGIGHKRKMAGNSSAATTTFDLYDDLNAFHQRKKSKMSPKRRRRNSPHGNNSVSFTRRSRQQHHHRSDAPNGAAESVRKKIQRAMKQEEEEKRRATGARTSQRVSGNTNGGQHFGGTRNSSNSSLEQVPTKKKKNSKKTSAKTMGVVVSAQEKGQRLEKKEKEQAAEKAKAGKSRLKGVVEVGQQTTENRKKQSTPRIVPKQNAKSDETDDGSKKSTANKKINQPASSSSSSTASIICKSKTKRTKTTVSEQPKGNDGVNQASPEPSTALLSSSSKEKEEQSMPPEQSTVVRGTRSRLALSKTTKTGGDDGNYDNNEGNFPNHPVEKTQVGTGSSCRNNEQSGGTDQTTGNIVSNDCNSQEETEPRVETKVNPAVDRHNIRARKAEVEPVLPGERGNKRARQSDGTESPTQSKKDACVPSKRHTRATPRKDVGTNSEMDSTPNKTQREEKSKPDNVVDEEPAVTRSSRRFGRRPKSGTDSTKEDSSSHHIVDKEPTKAKDLLSTPIDSKQRNDQSVEAATKPKTGRSTRSVSTKIDGKPPTKRKAPSTPKNVSNHNEQNEAEEVGVGTRVAILWPLERRYYEGTITKERLGKVFVEYDDGDKEWMDLSKEKFRVRRKAEPEATTNDDPDDVKTSSMSRVSEKGTKTVVEEETKTRRSNRSRKTARKDSEESVVEAYEESEEDEEPTVRRSFRAKKQSEERESTGDIVRKETRSVRTRKNSSMGAPPKKDDVVVRRSDRARKIEKPDQVSVKEASKRTSTKDGREGVSKSLHNHASEGEQTNSSSELPAVGSRVSVYWTGEGQYFDGVISKERNCRNGSRKCLVEYDDGDIEWVDFSSETYRLIPPGTARTPSTNKKRNQGSDRNKRKTVDEERDATPSTKDVCVGCRVSVYWPGEDEFYKGKVTKILSKKNSRQHLRFYVEYDDGDKGWVNGTTTKYYVLPQRSLASTSSRTVSKDGSNNTKDDDVGDEQMQSQIGNKAGTNKKTSKDVEMISVGSRVSLWWPQEGEYFDATVHRIVKSKSQPYYLEYDDGDREWVQLANKVFHVL